ncbi:hypothetical protein [Brevundimonas sp.]|uniref:hypothetical protein n=1 Tax=Brevundimonas sp. TaxID=1871086 RepID=UPI0026B93193|nr:hypothetical protein [Brevundimonas sp.]
MISVTRLSILALLAVSPPLAGCAALARPELPVCDGRARRPANPHGSVLVSAAPERPPEPASITETPQGDGGCP